jgi:hypothetical protein
MVEKNPVEVSNFNSPHGSGMVNHSNIAMTNVKILTRITKGSEQAPLLLYFGHFSIDIDDFGTYNFKGF